MDTVTVSPDYRILIPPKVRESLGIFPGQEIRVIEYRGCIELIPVKPVKEMRGFLKGIDTTVERESDCV